jgi:hypothetical protein
MKRTFAVIALAAAPVLAVNLTDDAPLAHFKGKDRETFDLVLNAVLDDGKPVPLEHGRTRRRRPVAR